MAVPAARSATVMNHRRLTAAISALSRSVPGTSALLPYFSIPHSACSPQLCSPDKRLRDQGGQHEYEPILPEILPAFGLFLPRRTILLSRLHRLDHPGKLLRGHDADARFARIDIDRDRSP